MEKAGFATMDQNIVLMSFWSENPPHLQFPEKNFDPCDFMLYKTYFSRNLTTSPATTTTCWMNGWWKSLNSWHSEIIEKINRNNSANWISLFAQIKFSTASLTLIDELTIPGSYLQPTHNKMYRIIWIRCWILCELVSECVISWWSIRIFEDWVKIMLFCWRLSPVLFTHTPQSSVPALGSEIFARIS